MVNLSWDNELDDFEALGYVAASLFCVTCAALAAGIFLYYLIIKLLIVIVYKSYALR